MQMINRVIRFLREVRAELRKVVWPTRQETITFTVVVLVTVAAVALMFWISDTIFAELFKLVIG